MNKQRSDTDHRYQHGNHDKGPAEVGGRASLVHPDNVNNRYVHVGAKGEGENFVTIDSYLLHRHRFWLQYCKQIDPIHSK